MLFHLKFGIFSLTFFNSWSSNSAHKDHPKAENPTTIQRKKNEIFPAQLLGFWCVLESGTRIHWLLGCSIPKIVFVWLVEWGKPQVPAYSSYWLVGIYFCFSSDPSQTSSWVPGEKIFPNRSISQALNQEDKNTSCHGNINSGVWKYQN